MAFGNVQSDVSGYIRRSQTSWCVLHNVPHLFLAAMAIDLSEFTRQTKCFISTAANRPLSELTQRTTQTLTHTCTGTSAVSQRRLYKPPAVALV